MLLQENVQRRLIAISIYLHDAESEHISTIAKSSYLRSAIILVSTVIEALVYDLVRSHSQKYGLPVDALKSYKTLHNLPKEVFGKENIVIAQICEKETAFKDDEEIKFIVLNRYLKRNKLISDIEYKQLELVRTERNKLHMQSLKCPDTGYTKRKFNRISTPLPNILQKVSSA